MKKTDKDIETDDLFKRCVEKWGIETQIKVAIEELGELIVELAKFGRKVNGSTKESITKEIADVMLMLAQVEYMLNIESEDVTEIMAKKIERLLRLLKG